MISASYTPTTTLPPNSQFLSYNANIHAQKRGFFYIFSSPKLRNPLPPELIRSILDYANLHFLTHTISLPRLQPVVIRQGFGIFASSGDKLILSTAELTKREIVSIRKIEVSVVSKAQRIGNFSGESSRTWFDLAVLRRKATNSQDKNTGDMENEALSGRGEPLEEIKPGMGLPIGDDTVRCRRELCRNRLGRKMPESHVAIVEKPGLWTTWNAQDSEGDRERWKDVWEGFRELEEGDRIVLLGCARSAGWENQVHHVRLWIWSAEEANNGLEEES